MARIHFRLSAADLTRAIKELGDRKKWYQAKCDEVALRLAQIGAHLARIKIAEYDAIDTGKLISSVTAPQQIRPGVYRITCFADNGKGHNYAIDVEYGTGIIGHDRPHPEADDSLYARGTHIIQRKDGEIGWFYPKDNKRHWTQGQPSRPFWHDTAEELPQYIQAAIKQTFGWD